MYVELEARKRTPIQASCDSASPLSIQSHDTVDQPSIDYGIMMSDLIEILENHENSLKKMKRAFVHMVHHMEHTAYTHIIQSERYRAVDSVEALFELLAPYLKKPDCSLLRALVSATNCDRAMERLSEYLKQSDNLVLAKSVGKSCVSPTEDVLVSESDTAADSNPVISSEPIVDSSTIPVTVTVARDEMSWGMLRHAQSLLCGLFRVPQFALQYDEVESGSVIIKWTTSKKIAMHMKAVVLDDGDLKLLLQERIVRVHVGLDYKIFVGNQVYWRVSIYTYTYYVHVQCMFINVLGVGKTSTTCLLLFQLLHSILRLPSL